MLKTNYISILKVALPMMLGMFIQSLVSITDSAFLARYDTNAFDASGNAGLLYVTLFMGLSGLGDSAQIIMSRRIGENRKNAVATLFNSSLIVNMSFGLLFFLLMVFVAPSLLETITENPILADMQIRFLDYRSPGFFLSAILISLNAFFLASGKTYAIMINSIVFATCNIFLDYCLVFGKFSFPEMGLEGAALASVISEGIAVLSSFILLFSMNARVKYNILSSFKIIGEDIKRILVVGTPLMLQGFLALATWTFFFFWIEQKSTYDLTVSQNIRALYMLAFVPIFGFGAATKTFVSQLMGQGKFREIRKVRFKIIVMVVLFTLLFFHGAIFYPEQLIRLINPKELYIKDSVEILQMVAGSIFMFAIFTPYFQSINGSGNTQATLFIEITCIIIYITCAYFFIKVWEWDIYYIWFVEYIYFGTLGLFSVGYLILFNWQKKII